MKKNYFISILGLLLLGTGILLFRLLPDTEPIFKTLPYLCIGIGCGLFGHGLGGIISLYCIKKDPNLEKQIRIEKDDERNIMLMNIAKSKAFDMMIYVFGALILTYAIMGISFMILIPFIICYLFVEFYSIYYLIKIDKKK